ncbi:hypothetical protein [Sphingobacterium chuzhouense]|uniref:Phage abortive infection protein n=1 Tax=Sphingobacterium chuzhouense TaxID=1742264 RepID=A0ABR7XPZ8_9SPHI|nr:hypothetical protein [Sphingobacterium chuzhouense]MBD1421218.1 hypothetical protein [Sphingobacterium chuzhouense]
MEIFEPNNFYNLAELLTNVLTGLIAVTGLIIAFKTFILAREAKEEWKKQKNFEIDIDGYAYTLDALKLLEDLRQDQYNPEVVKEHSQDILNDIFEKGDYETYNSYIKLYSYSHYYQGMKSSIFEIRKKALVILNISHDKELVDFYDTILTLEASLFSIHHNYHVYRLNTFIDRYQYKKIVKESYAQNIYFNSLRNQTPPSEVSDGDLYTQLYHKFFSLQQEDWLEPLRAKHVSFYFQKRVKQM